MKKCNGGLPFDMTSGADGCREHEVKLHGLRQVIIGEGRLHVVLHYHLPHVFLGHAIDLED